MASSMTTIVSTSPSPQLSSAKGTIRILSRALLYSAQFLLSSAQHPAHEGNAQQPLFQPQQGHYQSTPSLTLNVPPQCPPSTPLSCQNTSLVTDSCCFNTPGGQLLLTQFWDAHPATGPNDSWTLHGLWPDRCDGTYESYCDHSRRYEGIGETIKERDHDLWELMGTYWKDWKGDDEKLWGHEWKKHGTCVSTLRPECYEGYQERGEVLDYFARAMGLFRGLDTFRVSGSSLDKIWNGRQYVMRCCCFFFFVI